MRVSCKDTDTQHGQQATSVSPNRGVASLLRLCHYKLSLYNQLNLGSELDGGFFDRIFD